MRTLKHIFVIGTVSQSMMVFTQNNDNIAMIGNNWPRGATKHPRGSDLTPTHTHTYTPQLSTSSVYTGVERFVLLCPMVAHVPDLRV